MHISIIPEGLNYSVFSACSLKSFLGMLILKNPWPNPRDNIGMILSTLLANRRNYAIGMISRSLKILSMWKIKRCMQILLVTMHSIKQTKCPPTGRKKKRQTRNRKTEKIKKLEEFTTGTVHINPLRFSVILILLLPTVKCFQEYTVHRKQQQKEINTC